MAGHVDPNVQTRSISLRLQQGRTTWAAQRWIVYFTRLENILKKTLRNRIMKF